MNRFRCALKQLVEDQLESESLDNKIARLTHDFLQNVRGGQFYFAIYNTDTEEIYDGYKSYIEDIYCKYNKYVNNLYKSTQGMFNRVKMNYTPKVKQYFKDMDKNDKVYLAISHHIESICLEILSEIIVFDTKEQKDKVWYFLDNHKTMDSGDIIKNAM